MGRYASRLADFPRLGLSDEALQGIAPAKVEAALGSACDVADGFLSERYRLPLVWEFLPLAARTEDGAGDAIDCFNAARISLALDIVSLDPAGGDVALSVTVEHSDDAGDEDPWTTLGTFVLPSPLEAAHVTLSMGNSVVTPKRYLRVVWAIGNGEESDETGLGTVVFGVSWSGDDLKKAVCQIAAYDVMRVRGFDPGGRDEVFITSNKEARDWLFKIHEGKVSPQWIDQTPTVEEQRAYVRSKKSRGWTR